MRSILGHNFLWIQSQGGVYLNSEGLRPVNPKHCAVNQNNGKWSDYKSHKQCCDVNVPRILPFYAR
jgi:hypothetical protein